MKDRKVVRMGGAKQATPYLRKYISTLLNRRASSLLGAVDLGCGNGRNTRYLMSHGIVDVRSFDMEDDFGEKLLLGHDKIPVEDETVDIILANYIFMFLTDGECLQLMEEMSRVARKGCRVMVELEIVKQSLTSTKESAVGLKTMLQSTMERLGFSVIHSTMYRFIAEKA
jgi:trimethylamine:corrinoid methyltransferase-like protein